MTDFGTQLHNEARLKHISEIPRGEVVEANRLNAIIPICCVEGWDSCPHVPKKQRRAKRNIGL